MDTTPDSGSGSLGSIPSEGTNFITSYILLVRNQVFVILTEIGYML